MSKRKLFRLMAAKVNISESMMEKMYYGQKGAGGKLALRLEKVFGIEAPAWIDPRRYGLKQRMETIMRAMELH